MMRHSAKLTTIAAATVLAALSTTATATAGTTETTVITVQPGQAHQLINGFGFAEAFREPVITALPQSEQQQLGRLLFSSRTGAGFSIVRFGLGGATDPGDPISGPGDATEQLWLGHLAQEFGVGQFYADAWSAPAQFKTNDSLDNGGDLCGVPGAATCPQGDQRQAYARYLAGQAARFAAAGIPLAAVDFINEPEIGPDYASMQLTPGQAANFVPYLGRALAAAHLPTRVACCDNEGWGTAEQYVQAVLGDPASARYVGLITSHGYTGPPATQLTSDRPVWESEWADFSAWDPAWDDGTAGDGMTWASNIQAALTSGDVNAFFYWWGASASTANSGLIQVLGPTINLSKRYWAFAAFGRYIRPGAVRIGASSLAGDLSASAFRNRDGSTVIEILNTGTVSTPVRLRGLPGRGATAYVTNEADSLAPVTGPLTVPARSLLTVVIAR
ncbi:MAG TPA: glycoside hydrolase family 30 beta sandwich domain-containing protein [Trebonia sp.]|nr:glycoside hydrolase family 30 beta sandwich domain-containing protein [Trebonia sp.]